MSDDPFGLRRFVAAQENVFASALRELQAGRKRTHWMWFVFPQMRGLGQSPTAVFYGITSLAEARAYFEHPVLGQRLTEATRAVLAHEGRSLGAIFGSPDDMKFRSSMTLFAQAAEDVPNVFATALERLCNGVADQTTLDLINV